MNENLIIESFQNYLKEKGLDKNRLSLLILPDLFIDYYREVEFGEVDKGNDGDMILFQYGTYDWGNGKYFQINFTRQFYEVFDETDSHQIYQLGLTLLYLPEKFEDVTTYNKWSSEYSDLIEYRNVIINSSGYRKALEQIPVRSEIVVDLV